MEQQRISVIMSVRVPRVPNFLTLETPDGQGASMTVAIERLSDKELEAVALQWQQNLLALAKKRRNNKP